MKERAKYTASYAPLQIITQAGDTYTLPVNWSLTDAGTLSFNYKLSDRSFTHGSTLAGDGYASGRTIKVSCYLAGDTEEKYNDTLNQAYRYFCQTDYELRAGRADRRYRVAGCQKVEAKEIKGYKQRRSEITVTLLLADPFRYAKDSTTQTITFTKAVTDEIITINNPSGIDVPLIWTFTPPDGGTMSDITVIHVNTGKQFKLTDALLTAPAVGVVNGEKGTVRRDTYNAINAFSGVFIHADVGNNRYKVSCGAGTVSITFTGRWIV